MCPESFTRIKLDHGHPSRSGLILKNEDTPLVCVCGILHVSSVDICALQAILKAW